MFVLIVSTIEDAAIVGDPQFSPEMARLYQPPIENMVSQFTPNPSPRVLVLQTPQ